MLGSAWLYKTSASLVVSHTSARVNDVYNFLCLCPSSAKKEASLMTSGWVWALKMCLSTREESPSLWRPSHMSTSFSLVLLSPAPTRSPWMREKCCLTHHRYVICHVDIRLCVFVSGNRSSEFASRLCWLCFICLFPGRRDHQDHESLHKHDCEETLQCEVCVQLWNQLDQVINLQDSRCTQLRYTRHITSKQGEKIQRQQEEQITSTETVFQSF